MVRIKTSEFTNLKNSDLVVSAQRNVDAVTARPTISAEIFPGTPIVQTAITNLSQLTASAEDGTTATKNARDQARTVLIAYLFQWVGFIIQQANALPTQEEQVAYVEDLAFVPATRGGAIGHLTAVANPRVKPMSNAIQVEWTPKKGAQSYRLMKTEGYATEQSVWVEETITTRSKVVVQAPAGQVVSFAIYPIGSAGIGDVSEYVSAMANL